MNKFYITTPIYYINAPGHIGHFFSSVACDIFTRFHKLKNYDVYFTSGVDEFGQKALFEANKLNENPQVYADRMSVEFKNLLKFSNCEIDDFIRTTSERHKSSAKALWNKLMDNDQLYLGNYEGYYSVRDETWYDESEIKIINGKKIAPTGAEVEWVVEQNYFFKLSKWQDKLLEYYNSNPESIFPKSRYNEVISYIKGGLKDLCVSRSSFDWGVKVPNDNRFIIYIWVEACSSYIGALGYPNDSNFNKYWPFSMHVIGKDITIPHCCWWVAVLMAADINPPKKIITHGWIIKDSQKISKSLGNTIDPYDIVNRFGLDQVRYYFYSEFSFKNDGNFSEENLIKKTNSDLSNNFGNLIQRVCSFINNNNNSIVENNFDKLIEEDDHLIQLSIDKFVKYKENIENFQIDKGIKEVMELITQANIYIDKQKPWDLKKYDIKRMNIVLSILIEIIRRSSLMLYPVIPDSIKKIYQILNIDEKQLNFDHYDQIPIKKHTINLTSPIFPKIESIK